MPPHSIPVYSPLSVLFHTARMLLEQKRHRISQGSAVVRTVRQRKLKMADRKYDTMCLDSVIDYVLFGRLSMLDLLP
jgi:hypothetical protein